MIIEKKKLNQKKHIARTFLKKNGYIIIRNCFKKKILKEINNTIFHSLKKFIRIDLKKIQNLESQYFHSKLVELRKKSSKDFAFFFDTIQTASSYLRFWNSNEILKIVEIISNTNHNFLSTTDILLRIDSPIDRKNQLDWHQDSAYFRQNNNGYNGINCWAPLINCSYEMGPLEFLEKSHKLGLIQFKKSRDKNYGSLQRKINYYKLKNFKIKKFNMKVGDILVMNMDMVHRSGNNLSKKFRISGLCRYHKILSKDFNPGLNIYRYSNKKLNKKIHL